MKLNIRGQLIGYSICLVIFVGGSISFYSIYQGQKQQMSKFIEDSLASTKVLAMTIIDELYEFKISGLKNKLSAARISTDISSTFVLDTNGLVLTDGTSENSYRDKKLEDPFSTQVINSDTWIHQVVGETFKIGGPVMLVEEHLGYLIIGYSLTEISENIRQFRKNSIFITLVCMTFGILFAVILANKYSKPIRSIANTSKQIGMGQFDARVFVERNDELGFLASSVNQMAANLSQSHNQMVNLNTQLEKKVDELEKTTISKDYFDSIFQSMLDSIIVIDYESSTINMVNKAALDLLGYEKQELVGMQFSKVFTHYKEIMLSLEPENVKKNHVLHETEKYYCAKDGRQIPIYFSCTLLLDSSKNPQGIVCVAKDVTERKNAEIQINKANEDLRRSNKELNETQNQLVQSAKLASIGELATGICHELNQPLGYIRSNVQLAIMKGREHLNSNQAYKVLELVESGTTRMMDIVNHLRDFGRGVEFDLQPLDVTEVLENSLVLLNEQLRLRNIRIDKRISMQLPKILGNKNKLEQVFINLLSNARDALEETNEAQIVIKTENDRAPEMSEYIKISISNNGSFIRSTEIEKIFDPFFTTKAVGYGTGLGLSISYGIIQEHGGQINVTSVKGKGTTFCVILPVYQDGAIIDG